MKNRLICASLIACGLNGYAIADPQTVKDKAQGKSGSTGAASAQNAPLKNSPQNGALSGATSDGKQQSNEQVPNISSKDMIVQSDPLLIGLSVFNTLLGVGVIGLLVVNRKKRETETETETEAQIVAARRLQDGFDQKLSAVALEVREAFKEVRNELDRGREKSRQLGETQVTILRNQDGVLEELRNLGRRSEPKEPPQPEVPANREQIIQFATNLAQTPGLNAETAQWVALSRDVLPRITGPADLQQLPVSTLDELLCPAYLEIGSSLLSLNTGSDPRLQGRVTVLRESVLKYLSGLGLRVIAPVKGDRCQTQIHESRTDLAIKTLEESRHGLIYKVVKPGFRLGEQVLLKAEVALYNYYRFTEAKPAATDNGTIHTSENDFDSGDNADTQDMDDPFRSTGIESGEQSPSLSDVGTAIGQTVFDPDLSTDVLTAERSNPRERPAKPGMANEGSGESL